MTWLDDIAQPDPSTIRYMGENRDIVRVVGWMHEPAYLTATVMQYDSRGKLVQHARYTAKFWPTNERVFYFDFTEMGINKTIRLNDRYTGEQYGATVVTQDVSGINDITDALGVSVYPPDHILIDADNIKDGVITEDKLAFEIPEQTPGIYTGYGPPPLIVGAPVGSVYVDMDGDKTLYKLG